METTGKFEVSERLTGSQGLFDTLEEARAFVRSDAFSANGTNHPTPLNRREYSIWQGTERIEYSHPITGDRDGGGGRIVAL